jgi:hypothetical protein
MSHIGTEWENIVQGQASLQVYLEFGKVQPSELFVTDQDGETTETDTA